MVGLWWGYAGDMMRGCGYGGAVMKLWWGYGGVMVGLWWASYNETPC